MLILVLAVVIGASQGAKDKAVVTPNPQPRTTGQAQPPPPPINVTVVPAPKSEEERRQEAADKKTETEDRARDVKAQETMATFTRWLTVLGVGQLLAGLAAVWAAIIAARSSKDSVDIADRSLLLLNRPYLDAQNWRLKYHSSTYLGGDLHHIEISFDIANPGGVSARIDSISWNVGIGDSVEVASSTQTHNHVIPPKTFFPVEACCFPTEGLYKQCQSDAGLMVRVWGRVDYSHRLDDERHWKTFGRFCVIRWAGFEEGPQAQFLPIEAKGFNTEAGWSELESLPDPLSLYKPRVDPQLQIRRRAEADRRNAERKATKEQQKNRQP